VGATITGESKTKRFGHSEKKSRGGVAKKSPFKMPLEQGHDICELPPDKRILAGQRYRKSLYYVAQLTIWIGYLYFIARWLLILVYSRQTWQMWVMLLVEAIFSREFFSRP
jgi:hypothetical protein